MYPPEQEPPAFIEPWQHCRPRLKLPTGIRLLPASTRRALKEVPARAGRRIAKRLLALAVLVTGALAGCDQDTFDPKENWNYLVCTMKDRQQPEHVAFASRDGKAVAAYLRKVTSATVTPFEVIFDYYENGHLAAWRISRTDGIAELTEFGRIYRGTCTKAEGGKF